MKTPQEIQQILLRKFETKTPLGIVPTHKWKIKVIKDGVATCIPYIDARQVSERLDEAFGIDGWENKIIKEDGLSISIISAKFGSEWVEKSDIGVPRDWEKERNEKGNAMKAEASDALKRCATLWGIGRYLYSMEPVKLKASGKSVCTSNGTILATPDDLTSYINTMHPLRLKLIEIYKALPDGKYDKVFKEIYDLLTE